jgi:hypothetical protein
MKMEQIITSELLTRREAAEYLRICKSTLDKLKIPRVKIRHRVFFRKSELDNSIIQNTQIKGVKNDYR